MTFRTRSLAAVSLLTAASLLAPRVASALAPDFDGERGIEAGATFGYGTFVNSSERLFWRPVDAIGVTSPPTAITGGAHLRFHLGYRITPFLSAGVYGQLQWIGVTQIGVYPTTGFSGGAGVYARFYPMAFINQTLEARRVRFDGLLDRRRLDPFVSLGVEVYQSISRTTSDPGMPMFGANWNRTAIGIPIVVGADVRLVPAFALGVQLGITPLIGGSVDKVERRLDGVGNVSTTTTHYDSVDILNASFFVGLSARYTLTF